MTALGFRSVNFPCVSTLFIKMLTLFIKTSCRNLHKHLEPKHKLICVRYWFTKKLGEIKPIGFMSSLFCHKRGTPRQPSICPQARGTLTLDRLVVNNPQYTLEGLQEFSHVWLIFVFHKNEKEFVRSKVCPPRLGGRKVGLFSTRSPHRPNPIGLSLAKLDHVDDSTLFLSGIDLLDGTPILDVKPYIPEYDTPQPLLTDHMQCCSDNSVHNHTDHFGTDREEKVKSRSDSDLTDSTTEKKVNNKKIPPESCIENCFCEEENDINNKKDVHVKSPDWIVQPAFPKLEVTFTSRATNQLRMFSLDAKDPDFVLKFLQNSTEATRTITSILSEDPRPVHTRNQEKLYYFTVDNVHITCWFYDNTVEVIRVLPVSKGEHLI